MPQPAKPLPQTESANAIRHLRPVVILAWLMLLYTAYRGYFPSAAAFMPSVNPSPWINPVAYGLAAFFKLPTSHSLCLFRQFVGLPCVFCGITRSFILLSQGQWQNSLQYHLLGIPFYLATLFLAIFGLFNPQKTQAALGLLQDKRLLALLFVALAACWVWKLGQDPVFW